MTMTMGNLDAVKGKLAHTNGIHRSCVCNYVKGDEWVYPKYIVGLFLLMMMGQDGIFPGNL